VRICPAYESGRRVDAKTCGQHTVVVRSLVVIVAVAAAVVTAVAVLALHGRGGPRAMPAASAPAFLASVLRLQLADRYEEAWPTLDSADRSLAPRTTYVACESARAVPARLLSLRVLHVGREGVALPPGRTVPSVAVTFALRLATAYGGLRLEVTRHAVREDGRWTWVLAPAQRARYRRHECVVNGSA
jgi:hypothetical protein